MAGLLQVDGLAVAASFGDERLFAALRDRAGALVVSSQLKTDRRCSSSW